MSATATSTPCTSGSLSSYESNGCSIGNLNYSNFSYIQDTVTSPAASSIVLTPNGQGFTFSLLGNQPFVAPYQFIAQFEIDYKIVVDPASASVLTGAGNYLDQATGKAEITEYFCNGTAYLSAGVCGGPVQSLTIGTPDVGIPSTAASIVFSPPANGFEEVGILLTLGVDPGAQSSFESFTAQNAVVGSVPEPRSLALVGFAVIAGMNRLKKRKR